MYIFVQQILVYLNEDLNNVYVLYLVRFTFSTKLMQLKIWDPLFHRPLLMPWEKPGNFVFIILYCFPVYCTSHVLCESWSIKKTEHQRTDVQIVVLEKTLEIPLDSKEINQWILKEVNPDYALEGVMLKLKIQYFVYLLRRANTLVKILMLGKIEGKRRREFQKMKWLAKLTQWTSVRAKSGR